MDLTHPYFNFCYLDIYIHHIFLFESQSTAIIWAIRFRLIFLFILKKKKRSQKESESCLYSHLISFSPLHYTTTLWLYNNIFSLFFWTLLFFFLSFFLSHSPSSFTKAKQYINITTFFNGIIKASFCTLVNHYNDNDECEWSRW